jgi:hypothetical protein
MLPAYRVRKLSPSITIQLVETSEVFEQPVDRIASQPQRAGHGGDDSDSQHALSRVSAFAWSCTVSAGLSCAMVRTLTRRFLNLFQDVADHQQALLRLLPPGVFFL